MQYRRLAPSKYRGKCVEIAWLATSSTAIDNIEIFVCILLAGSEV
jgi:hypothetical protein